jgi:hypothetical protein
MIYDILRDFSGSQDGRFTERFSKGTQADLSDSLAEVAVRNGWARPVGVEVENKAVVTDGRQTGAIKRKK